MPQVLFFIQLSFPIDSIIILNKGPRSRTLQPVRGEGYEPAHKSRANAETRPRLGWEAVAVFREGGKNSALREGEPYSTSDLLLALQPLNKSHLSNGITTENTSSYLLQ